MEKEKISSLVENFESFSHKTDEGIEFWFARDVQKLLGYSKWENFRKIIHKAQISCELAEQQISHHFPDVRKTIQMPKGAEKEIEDIILTRYACYLIAQNGDPRKESIAFAQRYFAMQTRKGEISREHITNNTSVRNTLISRGITPENLSPEEDVKKIERKLKSEDKKNVKNLKN